MTATELYAALNAAGIEFDLIEIFDGVRMLLIEVEEQTEGEGE